MDLPTMEDEVSEVELSVAEKKKDILRVSSAQSIQPGCAQWVLASWLPRESKPQRKHLQYEVERRGGIPYKSWNPQQLADWLHQTKAPADKDPLPSTQQTKASTDTSASVAADIRQHPVLLDQVLQ
mmetsp:Transcript_6902/g.10581  ORF Transcript_6902/g.10581 Transcript_6902/m.10581 type:complete len:126 (-) Transcript_6902:363-740(-)